MWLLSFAFSHTDPTNSGSNVPFIITKTKAMAHKSK